MRYKTIGQIAKDFNDISGALQNDSETKDLLEQYINEIKTLQLWVKEIKSNKKSIYVVGKTSTGKSQFHNFILDIADSKLRLFKTSTIVETSVLQTLQHCESVDQAYAEISIKNVREWRKLKNQLQKFGIQLNNEEEFIKLKLASVEEISFLRDVIMAKSDAVDAFKISEAANSINIFFPLKYFKYHKFIDTPGLGSHESGTDNLVRNEFQGKSHILWFLDASQRSLSGSLTLLAGEKEFLKKNVDRIVFIGNKFDMLDNDEGIKNFHNTMTQELRITFLKEVQNILKSDKIPQDIIFTSLKKKELNKKYGDHTTIEAIQNLENKLLMNSKIVTFNNIDTFVNSLYPVLVKLKDNIESKKQKKFNIELTKSTQNIKRLSKEVLDIEGDIKILIPTIMRNAIFEIQSIKKVKNLNTHERYNQYLTDFKKIINKTHSKITNLTRAKLPYISKHLTTTLSSYKMIDDFSLKQDEGFFKKYFDDEELDGLKKELFDYVASKIYILGQIETQIISEFDDLRRKHLKIIDNEHSIAIGFLQKQKFLKKIIKLIDKTIEKLDNHNYLLLEEVEDDISNWSPAVTEGNSKNILDDFLYLNFLLDEHNILKQGITQ